MKYLIIFCLFFVSCINNAQKYELKGELEHTKQDKVFLAVYHGDHYNVIDSATINSNKFSLILKNEYLPGLYRVIIGETHKQASRKNDRYKIDLIINNENIHFNTSVPVNPDSINIVTSKENKLYYQLLEEEQAFNRKIGLLTTMLHNYPEDEEFHKDVKKEFVAVQKTFRELLYRWIKKYPESYFSKIAKAKIPPMISPDKEKHAQYEYLKAHFFDDMDFNDTALLRSNIYTKKVIEYLALHRERQHSPREQEEAFIHAVDKILLEAYINQEVYDFILNYLVDGFEKFKMEKVLNHIAEKHVGKSKCSTSDQNTLKKRLEAYQKLAVGKTAPKIDLDIPGYGPFEVENAKKNLTLVVFWASWCPHCKNIIPDIHELYASQDEVAFEVLSISLDTSKTAYNKLLQEYQLSWTNYCDYRGWDSPIAIKYNIYATPTMFLLNNQRKILAKPLTIYELKKALKRRKE